MNDNVIFKTSALVWGILGVFLIVGLLYQSRPRRPAVPLVQAKTETGIERPDVKELPLTNEDFDHLVANITTETPLEATVFSSVEERYEGTFKRGDCPESKEKKVRFLAPVGLDYDLYSYVPTDLVEIFPTIPTRDKNQVCFNRTAALHLNEMLTAAKSAGLTLQINSAYRSRGLQEFLFDKALKEHGPSGAKRVAKPGHSEHQLGTTVDFSVNAGNHAIQGADFGRTAEFDWLKDNAHEFGFILSYPKDTTKSTGYIFEPWHWRFVGEDNVIAFTTLRFQEIYFEE